MTKRLLLVDDDVSYATVLRGILRRDYKVDHTDSPQRAMEMARVENYDAILVDYCWEGDGRSFSEQRDVAYRILDRIRGMAPKVIHLVAAETPENTEAAKKMGITGVLRKGDVSMLRDPRIEKFRLLVPDPGFTPGKGYPVSE